MIAIQDIQEEYRVIETRDGFHIALWHVVPEDASAIVILCHGITVDATECGMYLELQKMLCERGFGVLRFDFRCHGQSSGNPMDLTLQGEKEDLRSVISFARSTWDKQVMILGTSFAGSSVVANTLAKSDHSIHLILWNPVINYEKTFLKPSTAWAKSILETRNSKHLPDKAYALIPNTKYVISKELAEEMHVDQTHQHLIASTAPVLIFHGTNDTYVPFEVVHEIAERNHNIELVVLQDVDHGFEGKRDYVYKETLTRLAEQDHPRV